jgi:hypothetical protein
MPKLARMPGVPTPTCCTTGRDATRPPFRRRVRPRPAGSPPPARVGRRSVCLPTAATAVPAATCLTNVPFWLPPVAHALAERADRRSRGAPDVACVAGIQSRDCVGTKLIANAAIAPEPSETLDGSDCERRRMKLVWRPDHRSRTLRTKVSCGTRRAARDPTLHLN